MRRTSPAPERGGRRRAGAVARAVPDRYTQGMTASGPMTIRVQGMPGPPHHPVRPFARVAQPPVAPLLAAVPAERERAIRAGNIRLQ